VNNVKVVPAWDMTEEEWLTARENGIGGSDAGTVCGVNSYKSPYALWVEKSKLVERTFTGNEATDWGHRLEPVVAEAYAEKYKKAVVSWPVIIFSEKNPFMFANLDYVIVEPSDEFPVGVVSTWRSIEEPKNVFGILEIKTSGIASPGSAYQWADNSVPQSYMLQGYHYGIVTGWESLTFCALIGGHGLTVREMEWDSDIAENLVIAESQFWDLVQSGVAPATDGSDATESAQQQRYPRHEVGVSFEGGSELGSLWNEFSAAKIVAEEADTARKALRAQIVELVGNAEVATVEGKVILSYKASKDVETLDTDRLKKEAPEIFEQFKKVRPGSRTLRGIK
jgi:putative phage-type endonuclease